MTNPKKAKAQAHHEEESKNLLPTILVILAFIGGAAIAAVWFQTKKAEEAETGLVLEEMVEETTDTLVVTPPTPETTDSMPKEDEGDIEADVTEDAEDPEPQINKAEIRAVMAGYRGKTTAETDISISQSTEEYAMGTVKFEGEMGGGWFLAALVDGEWVIVADGNGTVICQDIEGYDFPVDMVPDCWDEVTQELVERQPEI